MKNKLFSWDLCREGMRQTKVFGITLTIISVVISIMAIALQTGNPSCVMEYSIFEMAPQVFFMPIATPFFMIVLLGFLNKRKASDFYHAIPYTRECLFLSFVIAGIIWNFIIMLSGTVVALAGAAVFKSIALETKDTLIYIIVPFLASILITVTTALAMSLTGTLLTNFLASVILLFAPRTFYILLKIVYREQLGFVVFGTENPVLDYRNNAVFYLLGNLFTNVFGSHSSGFHVMTIVYTLLLSVVVLLLGMWVFKKRKSENATKASVTRTMQAVFRSVPTMFICLWPIFMLYCRFTGDTGTSMRVIIILYVVAAIVYFLYELITTRSVRNVVKSIPVLFVIAILNVVCIFTMVKANERETHRFDDYGVIESVSIANTYLGYPWGSASDVKITDADTIELLGDALKDEVARQNSYWYDDYSGSTFYITFHSSGKDYVRRIRMNKPIYEKLVEQLEANEEYAYHFGQLVLPDENSTVEVYDDTGYYCGITAAEASHILLALSDEMQAKSFREKLSLAENDDSDKLFSIQYYCEDSEKTQQGGCFDYYSSSYRYNNGKTVSVSVGTNFPKTCEKYIKYNNEKTLSSFDDIYNKMQLNIDAICSGKLNDTGNLSYLDYGVTISLIGNNNSGSVYTDISASYDYVDDDSSQIGWASYPSEEYMEVFKELGDCIEMKNITAEDIENGITMLSVYTSGYNAPYVYIENEVYSIDENISENVIFAVKPGRENDVKAIMNRLSRLDNITIGE